MLFQQTPQPGAPANSSAAHPATDAKPGLPKENQSGAESYSVVIADDDRSIADLVAMNLRRLGHHVVGIARNGKEAVDMVLKHRPTAVVIDVHMPVLDGIQAAREMLKQYPVAVVLSTGLTDLKTLDRAADARLSSYLVKPFSPAQLKVALHLAVVRSGSNPAVASAEA